MTPSIDADATGRAALNALLTASIKEQRTRRRWGIFFKIVYLIIVLVILALIFGKDTESSSTTGKHVALVDVQGIIMDGMEADADNIVKGLTQAFANKNSIGVILRINSPGGSPVQSDYVFSAMQRLRMQYPDKHLYAVCVDVCASGAYYMAVGAEKIYANPSSLVGSIGVLMDGFGFVETLQKVGVERRLLTSGQHKGFLDPFSPLKVDELAFAQDMLDDVHQQFINVVKQGRQNRLQLADPNLFSGMAWTGNKALDLGLIDDFASAGEVAREAFKTENIVDYTVQPDYLERFAQVMGAEMTNKAALLLGLNSPRLH